METQVLEGTWEEIARQADRFAGRKVRVTILEDEPTEKPKPNLAMLEALRKVRERSKNMPESSGKDTLKMLREARSGGMFNDESDE
jgi:hypothetical protein